MARLARLICVCAGVAVAVWLLPASIHIVDWPASGPVRVALFAPLWQLWMALAVAAAVGRRSRSGVRHRGRAATVSDTALTPLALLWLWAIPYLPWLPDRAPVLLALAGPLRWGVLALARVRICADAALASRGVTADAVPLPGRRDDLRRQPRALSRLRPVVGRRPSAPAPTSRTTSSSRRACCAITISRSRTTTRAATTASTSAANCGPTSCAAA